MELSVSNIGWKSEYDGLVYRLMRQYGYTGLEIAPTRIFPDRPYEKLAEAKEWASHIKAAYGFSVPSIQSIWFGKTESLFGSPAEREALAAYTRKAIDFAEVIGCRNLVFGCPRNRVIPDRAAECTGVAFFKETGDYAFLHDTVLSIEANPPIYGTNYINDTQSALALVDRVGSDGFKLNLDVGTMIYNRESVSLLAGKVKAVNHVHISEPGLQPIRKRGLHAELMELLREEGYSGSVSIEMGAAEGISQIEKAMIYIKGVIQN